VGLLPLDSLRYSLKLVEGFFSEVRMQDSLL
jgi:hypothetical protein